jgi:nucleosome binding factor SPN SPT16 subunit
MRQAHLGEKHPEWRRKLKGIAQGGDNHWTKKKKFSEKSKKKMSETHKKLYQNGYEHPNKKKILQYNLNGNFIKEWDSLVEASKALNINRTGITNCLRRKSKHAGGFIWNYKFDKN